MDSLHGHSDVYTFSKKKQQHTNKFTPYLPNLNEIY